MVHNYFTVINDFVVIIIQKLTVVCSKCKHINSMTPLSECTLLMLLYWNQNEYSGFAFYSVLVYHLRIRIRFPYVRSQGDNFPGQLPEHPGLDFRGNLVFSFLHTTVDALRIMSWCKCTFCVLSFNLTPQSSQLYSILVFYLLQRHVFVDKIGAKFSKGIALTIRWTCPVLAIWEIVLVYFTLPEYYNKNTKRYNCIVTLFLLLPTLTKLHSTHWIPTTASSRISCYDKLWNILDFWVFW